MPARRPTTKRWPRAWGWLLAAALAIVLWIILIAAVVSIVHILGEVISERFS